MSALQPFAKVLARSTFNVPPNFRLSFGVIEKTPQQECMLVIRVQQILDLRGDLPKSEVEEISELVENEETA